MVNASVQCSLLPAPPLLSVSSLECNSIEFDIDQEDATAVEAISDDDDNDKEYSTEMRDTTTA